MRVAALTILTMLGAAGPAAAADHANAPAAGTCLSSGDAQEIVGSQQVVTPARAIVAARESVPNAEVLRASLCQEPDMLVYRITILRRDGRIVRVTVDAPSGKIKTVH